MTVQEQIKTLRTRQNSLKRKIENKPTYDEMCRLCDEQMELSNQVKALERTVKFLER